MTQTKKIGVLGKRRLTGVEEVRFRRFGQLLAALGNEVVLLDVGGVANSVREGMKAEGKVVQPIDSDVIGNSDTTFVYPDARFLERLKKKYPDKDFSPASRDIHLLTPANLLQWLSKLEAVLKEEDIPLPP